MRSKSEIMSDIIRAPQEDGVRLEYADAIEAKDPEYAKYIRRDVAEFPGLIESCARDNNDSVEPRIAQPFLEHCYDVIFYRGFVEGLVIDPYVFIDRGHRLLEQAPIQKITFRPKDLGGPIPDRRARIPSPIRELTVCPLLDRLPAISFEGSHYQYWQMNDEDIECMLRCQYLSRALLLDLSKVTSFMDPSFADFWKRALSRPEFRKMLRIEAPLFPGEVELIDYDDDWVRRHIAQPMPDAGRELEREHGYLPALHLANNWRELVLRDHELLVYAQRGQLPRFPPGAPVTPEMYERPPSVEHVTSLP